jgi:hypothetical protein
MKHALFFLYAGLTLLIGVAIFIWPHLSLFLASDTCMAAGGSFDFSLVRCDFRQSHAYVVFDLWRFWVAFAGGCLGVALAGCGLFRSRPGNSFGSQPLRGPA